MDFIGREAELQKLAGQFSRQSSASLVYGKRRVGKTSLILQAARSFKGEVIYYECIRSSVEDNLDRLTRQIATIAENPYLSFRDFTEPFAYLATLDRRVLVVIDEYQNLKSLARTGEMDSLFQATLDGLGEGVHVVLAGSYISVMKELLEEGNPLFGRFTCTINLKEMDYLDAARFAPKLSARDKSAFYAVFGGLPFANAKIDFSRPLANNICELLLAPNGILRVYMEYVLFAEVAKLSSANRILAALGNGRKRYSEIEQAARLPQNGAADKTLKMLIDMQVVQKSTPINKANDAKKRFYEIADNLTRFYYAYVFGNERYIEVQGTYGFFEAMVKPSLTQFIARRFEGIVAEYFMRLARRSDQGDRALPGEDAVRIIDVGRLWYDDAANKAHAEFDVALRHLDNAYSFYEAKWRETSMGKAECDKEAAQVARIAELTGIDVRRCGFVSLGGFDFKSDDYDLLLADDLYT